MDVEVIDSELNIVNASSSTYNDAELTWTQGPTGLITAKYIVNEGEDDQASALQLFNITVTDAAGNSAKCDKSQDVQKTIDANRPEVLNVTTCDLDQDGMIDAYEIIFNENVNDSSLAFGACTVDGYSLLSGLAGFDTGECSNDSIIYILFTESGSSDTNALPNVTADADAISDLAGNGIAAVAAEDVTEEDGAAPVILLIESEAHEDDGDGILGLNDYINFTSVPSLPADVDHINTSCFNGVELEWTLVDGNWTATYTVLEGHTSSMDAQLTGVYATDTAGNAGPEVDDEATYTINAGGPIIISAVTMDKNHNGLIDGYNVSFIDAINDCTVNMSNWNVEGHEVCSWSTGDVANDSNIYVYFCETPEDNTAALPNLTISNPEVTDMDGDALKAEFCDDNDDITETDGASPVLMYSYVDSDDSWGCEGYEIDLNFSEYVNIGQGSNVTFIGGDYYICSYEFDYDGQLQTGDSPEITAINNVEDEAGNAAVLYGDSGVVVNTFRKEIVEGYNFVSFPIADEGTVTLADVGLDDECKVEAVWTYNPQDGWVFSTDGTFEIEGGVGYIVVANKDFILAPNVNNYPAEFESPASTAVYEGWNLVGHYKAHDQCTYGAFETLIATTPYDTSSINSVMYEQKTAGELDLRELNAYRDDYRDIVTGNAYWINVDSEDIYSVGSSYGFWRH